ncbi:hypothetical protein AB1N83_010083 [Pleurotus pulmonarius]
MARRRQARSGISLSTSLNSTLGELTLDSIFLVRGGGFSQEKAMYLVMYTQGLLDHPYPCARWSHFVVFVDVLYALVCMRNSPTEDS